jgi:hypothetical protein
MGIWQSGYGATIGTRDATKNVDNIFAFNHVANGTNYAASIDAGSAILVNNILHGGYSSSGINSPIYMGITGSGTAATAATVTLQNNIISLNSFTGVSARMLLSNNVNDVILGNNNIFDVNVNPATGYPYYKFRNVDYAGTSSTANLVAAIAAVTPGAQSNTQWKIIDTDNNCGNPLPGPQWVGKGKSLVSGTDGATVTGYTDGAFGYRTDLNGELLDANHIGCYQPINSRGGRL